MAPDSLSALISKYLEIQETKRKSLLKKYRKSGFIAVALIIVLSIASDILFNSAYTGLFFVLALVYFIYQLVVKTKKYKEDYTSDFIKPLMKHLYPSLKYEPKSMVDEAIFNRSELFEDGQQTYKGEDLFEGTIDSCKVGFSELRVSRKSSNNSSSMSILSGIFFYMEGHFQIPRPYFIENESTTLSISNKFKPGSPFTQLKKVRVGSSEENVRFNVYTHPNETAPPEVPAGFLKVMTEIDDLMQEYFPGPDIRLSLQSKMISISLNPNRIFEPPILKKAEEHAKTLNRNLKIIEKLVSLRSFFQH